MQPFIQNTRAGRAARSTVRSIIGEISAFEGIIGLGTHFLAGWTVQRTNAVDTGIAGRTDIAARTAVRRIAHHVHTVEAGIP